MATVIIHYSSWPEFLSGPVASVARLISSFLMKIY
jgi:hypothetical protein